MQNTPIKLGLRPRDAIAAIGSKKLYLEAVRRGLLKPVIREHKLTLFTAEAVAAAFKQIAAGALSEPKTTEEVGQ